MLPHPSADLHGAKLVQKPLTDLSLRSVSNPASGHTMLWDSVTRGFGVRVGKQSKTFLVLIGQGRRHTIGRYDPQGPWTLAAARTEARRILAEKTLGKTKPRFLAYDDARQRFLAEVKIRPTTLSGYRSRLNRMDWGRSNLADITPRNVLKQLTRFDGPMEKRYAFVTLRRFFNWCVEQHLLDSAPTEKLSTPEKNDSRERVLTTDELNAIWHACPDDHFGKIVKVLMLTGQRRGEIQHMTLEGDVATIPGAHTKNKRAHALPVPALAANLLTAPLKWVGWGKSKARLDAASGVANWTLHDLRRTYSTTLGSLRTPPHIIEALLNHKTGVVSGVAATYNRFLYLEECREAVARFQQWIVPHLSVSVTPPGA